MSVLTLPQAQAHLNVTDAQYDAEIQSMISAAEAVIARHVGPLASTATTARVRGGTCGLVLPTSPAVSLTSVTPVDGTAISLSTLYLDTRAGVVTYNSGGTFTERFYDVVYNAGRATCPDDLLMAVKELVRHMWSTQRGPSRRPGSQSSDSMANTVPGAGHALPFTVSELLAPHLQPGFA